MRELGNLTNSDVIKRARFFQKLHVWPPPTILDFKGWLNNFKFETEKAIAYRLLNFFMFYPQQMADKLLLYALNLSGNFLSNHLTNWQNNNFKNRCFYSYFPGEIPNPSDSGLRFITKIRNHLNVDEKRLIEFKNIPKVLQQNKEPIVIIFVDDFIGTGNQCIKAWSKHKFNNSNETLEQISKHNNHLFVYVALIANKIGYHRITSKCDNLHLSVSHILGDDYNLFNPNCFCWNGNKELFEEGTNFILSKSHEIGIPDNNGKYPVDARGFNAQGLALAIEDIPPDAVPAIFYWCQDNWIPLIKRSYKRC